MAGGPVAPDARVAQQSDGGPKAVGQLGPAVANPEEHSRAGLGPGAGLPEDQAAEVPQAGGGGELVEGDPGDPMTDPEALLPQVAAVEGLLQPLGLLGGQPGRSLVDAHPFVLEGLPGRHPLEDALGDELDLLEGQLRRERAEGEGKIGAGIEAHGPREGEGGGDPEGRRRIEQIAGGGLLPEEHRPGGRQRGVKGIRVQEEGGLLQPDPPLPDVEGSPRIQVDDLLHHPVLPPKAGMRDVRLSKLARSSSGVFPSINKTGGCA